MSRWILSAEDRLSEGLMEVEGPLSTPCWEWVKSLHSKGYGQIWFNGKLWLVHRLSWFLHNGPIPDGMLICHHCDNRPCGNPTHLFLGTDADNIHDMMTKGRYVNGRTLNR